MLEWTLQLECERLAASDPLGMGDEPQDKAVCYSRLIEEYVTSVLQGEVPDSEIQSTKRVISFRNKQIEALTLKFPENKVPLVRRIEQMYAVVARLAKQKYASVELPKDARLEDTFTSHDSKFSIFATPDNTYVEFAREGEKTAHTYKLNMRIMELDATVLYSLAVHDPLRLVLDDSVLNMFVSIEEPADLKKSQYVSLIEEYASNAIRHEEPDTTESSMVGSSSGTHGIDSKNFSAMLYGDQIIEKITLRYDETKAPLVRRLHRLYSIFTSLAAGVHAPAKIPENARLQDIFTSHHSQLFVFETPENDTYIRLRKDADKGVKWRDAEPVTYHLTNHHPETR